jgi:hypothetical protein
MLKLSELSSRPRKGTAPTFKTYLALGLTQHLAAVF